jgi:CheY-like chemotaxis protein
LIVEARHVTLDDAFLAQHPGARAGDHVKLTVTDNGVGMDGATLSQVFEPFFTTKGPGQGTGLGLATVYGIVKQHEGYITVDSSPGRGTTFTIYLPCAIEAAVEEETTSTAEPAGRGTETILLVEDESEVRSLAGEILQASGYTVLQAGNAAEALEVSKRHQGTIDLLVTDVVMPQMSGRELAERLVALGPTMKVLYMSGYTDDAIVHHGILDPGIVLLQKPFAPDTLVKQIRSVLDSPNPPA